MQFQPDTALSTTAIIAIICVNGFRITVAEMYFIMFHPSFSRLSVLSEKKRSWVRSNNSLHKVFILIMQKKSSHHFWLWKIQGIFWYLDSLMPIPLRQKSKKYITNDPVCISSSWIIQGFLSQVVIQLSLIFLSQHLQLGCFLSFIQPSMQSSYAPDS